ncbi:hypothetical protein CON64_18485 [Bacillus pseudomycoides]|nr:hypothetical protein CON64_18485 [Bacillus pseudomycoides]
MSTTMIKDMVIPEVIADGIEQKLGKLIKFTPLAEMDYSLAAQEGMTVVFPTWNYIGDAIDVAEGAAITPEKITAASKKFAVKKAVKDIAMTDESILATNGAVIGETEKQLAVAIANKIDGEAVEQLRTATEGGTLEFTQVGLATLRVAFGEDIEEAFLFVSPANYGKILAMPEFVPVQLGEAFLAGQVGHVMGLNIVVTGRLTDTEAILMKRGALGISLKRAVNVETERKMETRSQVVGADVHYVVYLKDETRALSLKVAKEEASATRKAAAK